MALNPLVIPQQQQSLHHHHSRTASASSSASSNHHLYDGYSQAHSYPLGRPPHNLPLHNRTSSASSAAFSLQTHLTSPADSPPNLTAAHPQAGPAAYKSLGVGRNPHQRRPRGGSSPYSRTGDDHYSSSASSRSGSACSDAEQDDLSMYFGQQHNPFPQQHSLPHADYSTLFVHGAQAGYSLGSHMTHGISHLEASNTVGAFGNMSLDPEQALEQLAANVRSSTTTTASDRAKQIFVQAWLTANYAPYPDGNVPRQGLYNSYRRVCDQYNIPHINTATLGKAIRLCFPAIKTRRLGVRGNSKYHYCGIRPATVAEAEFLQDFVRRTTNHSAIAAGSRRGAAAAAAAAAAAGNGHGSDEEEDEDSEASSGLDAPGREPQFTFNNQPHLPLNGSSGPSSLNGLSGSGLPHPLTLGGMKSPTLFSMTDDKTPTTNGVLQAAQAQAGMNMGLNYGPSQTQIRTKRGLGSTDSNIPSSAGSRPGTSGSGGTPATSFLGQSSDPTAPAPGLSVRNLPNFPSINEALGIDSSAQIRSSTSGSPGAASSSPSQSHKEETSPTLSSATTGSKITSPQQLAALEVWRWFEDHLDGLLESVRSWRFDQFEIHLRTFWASLNGDYREVVHAPAVAGLMVKADAVVYDEILEILKAQLLGQIPPQVLTSLRQLAGKMEKILLLALENYGNTFVEPKVELGARFGHLVLRFLDMYQVTQALSSVLNNHKQLVDMRRAWGEIDFESVRNQAALVCNCRHGDLLQLLEVDFVQLLDGLLAISGSGGVNGNVVTSDPVREVMEWADSCIERLMNGGNGAVEERASMGLRSVLIRWGYVTSQIMRDLTIRSDPAFGAFQILKLFCDDWIALQVLRSVALSTNSIQASVELPQQYLALSPMPGQEYTGDATARDPHSSLQSSHLMDHTPTTTSMLAALHDYNPTSTASSLGPSGLSASFTPSYASLSYGSVDVPAGSRPDDSMLGVQHQHGHHQGMLSSSSFADFQAPSQFDITSFLASESSGGVMATGPPGTSDAPGATPASDRSASIAPIEGGVSAPGPADHDNDVKDEV
ncbi:hypothetical protein FRC02_000931 [Tulasnella sp. 418]|nr:hypothetical protein FRC02_000931 [Tulasnella sp. 418]